MLPPANQPFMDDHIAYALVLVALPWPAPAPRGGSDAHTTELSLVRRYPALR